MGRFIALVLASIVQAIQDGAIQALREHIMRGRGRDDDHTGLLQVAVWQPARAAWKRARHRYRTSWANVDSWVETPDQACFMQQEMQMVPTPDEIFGTLLHTVQRQLEGRCFPK